MFAALTALTIAPRALRASEARIGDCESQDATHICLAIRYVAFEGSAGTPVVDRQVAKRNLDYINKVWNQCNLGFEIQDFVTVDPSREGLPFHTGNYSDLEDIRNKFRANNELLVVVTGAWNRRGSLGSSPANAWTAMPGTAPYGAVLEQPVGGYANIIAHELGHYLNLDHYPSDKHDLMSPIIYESSQKLSQTQCETARAAALEYWQPMLRSPSAPDVIRAGSTAPARLVTLHKSTG